MQSKEDVKKLAKKLKKASEKLGYDLKLTHALEIISNVNWDQEWNAVNAQFNKLEEKYKKEIDSLKNLLSIEMNYQKMFTLEDIKNKQTNLHIIKRLLLSDSLRDQVNLGLLVDKGQFLLESFMKSPNSLFVGEMGSGKTIAARYTVMNWMISNSDQTNLFIVDTVKGAYDYKDLFAYSQIKSALSPNQVHGLIDLLYKESIARKNKFSEVGAKDLLDYEKKTGEKISRCLTVLEELHALTYSVFNFEKDYKIKGTTANKFHNLMRTGRSLGIWFIGVAQRATSSDLPPQIVPNFTNKQVFKVSKAEASYVLGDYRPSQLKSDQKGRCFSDYGEIQFPFIGDEDFRNIIAKHIVKRDSKSFIMKDILVDEVLRGEIKLSVNHLLNSDNFNDFIKTMIIKEHMILKEYESYMIIKNKKDELILSLSSKDKIEAKMIQNMIFEMKQNNCIDGVIYSKETKIDTEIYQFANLNNIRIIDYDDLLKIEESFT